MSFRGRRPRDPDGAGCVGRRPRNPAGLAGGWSGAGTRLARSSAEQTGIVRVGSGRASSTTGACHQHGRVDSSVGAGGSCTSGDPAGASLGMTALRFACNRIREEPALYFPARAAHAFSACLPVLSSWRKARAEACPCAMDGADRRIWPRSARRLPGHGSKNAGHSRSLCRRRSGRVRRESRLHLFARGGVGACWTDDPAGRRSRPDRIFFRAPRCGGPAAREGG